jgi:hypothetical protein
MYTDYAEFHHVGFKKRREEFGATLKRLVPSVGRKKSQEDGTTYYYYIFPPCAVARAEFAKGANMDIDWDAIAVSPEESVGNMKIPDPFHDVLRVDAEAAYDNAQEIQDKLVPIYRYFLYTSVEICEERLLFEFEEYVQAMFREEFPKLTPQIPVIRSQGQLRMLRWYSYSAWDIGSVSGRLPNCHFGLDVSSCIVTNDYTQVGIEDGQDVLTAKAQFRYRGKIEASEFNLSWTYSVDATGLHKRLGKQT